MKFRLRIVRSRPGTPHATRTDLENAGDSPLQPKPSSFPCVRSLNLSPARRFLSAAWGECRNHARAVFVLTPEERRVVMLVTALFILGLAVRLVRGCAAAPQETYPGRVPDTPRTEDTAPPGFR